MQAKLQKRFIAGAICPSCQQMDKIMVYKIAGNSFAECVNCGFKQAAQDQKAKPKEAAEKKVLWLDKEQ